MGGGPRKGCHQLQVSLGASASLFLGVNIYRFVYCLPYTLGCLPTGENRAGCATPTLPFPTRAGQRGPGEACCLWVCWGKLGVRKPGSWPRGWVGWCGQGHLSEL